MNANSMKLHWELVKVSSVFKLVKTKVQPKLDKIWVLAAKSCSASKSVACDAFNITSTHNNNNNKQTPIIIIIIYETNNVFYV